MKSHCWTPALITAATLLLAGCSTNPPHEPLGLAVDTMRQSQTHNPDAADQHGPLRLDGVKAHQVITDYRGQSESATGVAGDIEINIGD
ncbi:hypothetical protein [Marinobacterium weihaiense]|uniref:Lipoprotein n=1 Tax=Marinobacterium weihaiense TaxID=2851016 RepID=A0ABS6MB22_9GAMM|nr:hypothetical protein [Marinobacterium weihaiense]MBV0933492.1 hypothetical protein [Marinobacterium weihaiense]